MAKVTSNNNINIEVACWLLKLGRLTEFRLAIRLIRDSSITEDIEREAAMYTGAAAGSIG